MSNLPEEIVNFRDFGGYASRHGGRLHRDLLYRSGQLAGIDATDVDRLLELDFALVADLRYTSERRQSRSPWPQRYAGRILAHDGDRVGEAPHLQLLHANRLTVQAVEDFFADYYATLPYDPLYRDLFSQVLRALPDAKGRVLIHCTAGKDRTGILVALIHHALGVDWSDIVADYARSHTDPGLIRQAPRIIAGISAKYGRSPDVDAVRALLGVKELYIKLAFDAITDRSGSIDAYLDDLGFDQAARKAAVARCVE